jgi:hypothetical protein
MKTRLAILSAEGLSLFLYLSGIFPAASLGLGKFRPIVNLNVQNLSNSYKECEQSRVGEGPDCRTLYSIGRATGGLNFWKKSREYKVITQARRLVEKRQKDSVTR